MTLRRGGQSVKLTEREGLSAVSSLDEFGGRWGDFLGRHGLQGGGATGRKACPTDQWNFFFCIPFLLCQEAPGEVQP